MSVLSDEASQKKIIRNPRKRFELGAPLVKRMLDQIREKKGNRSAKKRLGQIASSQKDDALIRIAALFGKALLQAEKKSGFDSGDQGEQSMLLLMMAWALFGGSVGRPPKWTSNENRDLIAEITRLRLSKPDLKSDKERCNYLNQRDRKAGPYNGVSAATIRRRLQYAKKAET